MNAIELLKQDHRAVRELFKSHEAAGEQAYIEKRGIADRIFKDLDVHTQIEEELFYPAARGAATEKIEKLVPEAYEEHRVAKGLIAELRVTAVELEQWDAKMKVLSESIDHHIEEEQNELFPAVEKALGNTYLGELGERMTIRKRELSGTSPSLGGTLVSMVTRAYDSLTGNGNSASRAKPRIAAVKRTTRAKAATKKPAAKSAAKTMKRVVAKTKRVASKAKTATTKRVQAGTKKMKARASAARTRVAKVARTAKVSKGSRKNTTKGRRSARR